jgi:hypothetical protein
MHAVQSPQAVNVLKGFYEKSPAATALLETGKGSDEPEPMPEFEK